MGQFKVRGTHEAIYVPHFVGIPTWKGKKKRKKKHTRNLFLSSKWTIKSGIAKNGLVPTLRRAVASRKSSNFASRHRRTVLGQTGCCVVCACQEGQPLVLAIQNWGIEKTYNRIPVDNPSLPIQYYFESQLVYHRVAGTTP